MKSSPEKLRLTPSAQRIVARFRSLAAEFPSDAAGHLVLSIVADESLGGRRLRELGLNLADICSGALGDRVAAAATQIANATDTRQPPDVQHGSSPNTAIAPSDSPEWLRNIVSAAGAIARRQDADSEVSSEHLLQAVLEIQNPAGERLADIGITIERFHNNTSSEVPVADPIQVDFELNDESPEAAAAAASTGRNAAPLAEPTVLPLLDANLNRAREAVRVLEDFSRFIVRDQPVTAQLKQLRHDIVKAERLLLQQGINFRSGRDVASDVGTTLTTTTEQQRLCLQDVVIANARRLQESLRSLEEFGKTVCPPFAEHIKQLRYASYATEQCLLIAAKAALPSSTTQLDPALPCGDRPSEGNQQAMAVWRQQRLQASVLYVLLTEKLCRRPWKEVVERSIRGGVDIIQLREKTLSAAALARRIRWLNSACHEAGVLCIVNDAVQLAARHHADGVHIGQEDMSSVDARGLLKPGQLLGISTHSVDQIRSALPIADYLGVGPVFSSQTKSFDYLAGLELVRKAAEECPIPWFAIGGITPERVAQLKEAGARRIAVSAAVIGADDPRAAAAELKSELANPAF